MSFDPFFLSEIFRSAGGTYTLGQTSAYLYYADDVVSDDPSDILWQLGDIVGEGFVGTSIVANPGVAFTYVGATADGSGFLATFDFNGQYFLFQYAFTYQYGDPVSITNGSFAICFASGTRIATTAGLVPVEDLRVGDLAVAASGAVRTVCWIGHRSVACTGSSALMAPVRVKTNAFGSGMPARDVFLSPGHPVLVERLGREALVPIMQLINGTTVARTALASVTYWHVELDCHDILLADGLPAESYFDMGARGWFDNDLDDAFASLAGLPGESEPDGQHGRCREVVTRGPLVEAERLRLAGLFYADLTAQCAWPVRDASAAAV